MDHKQYTTLLEVLSDLPDPRNARGKRYPWLLLLILITAGLASGQQSARAIAQWIRLHAVALRHALPDLSRLPSESTIARTIHQIDVAVLEKGVAALHQTAAEAAPFSAWITTPCGTRLRAQALDGKALRGATACGAPTHLVSLVLHTCGTTLAQTAVNYKRSEITTVPRLLHNRDLTDTITTMDALLTQRTIAQQICDQNGFYLMVVKANQPQMYDAIALFFELPASAADQEQLSSVQTTSKAHGRTEQRKLECLRTDLSDLNWPGATHIIRRTIQRLVHRTGKSSQTVTYGVTNLPPHETSARLLERLWRGHWAIESKSHYVRDVTMGEDRCHIRRGQAPQALAALRNSLLLLWRRAGWSNIADAIRATAASIPAALSLIGLSPTMT
jgi:predicted transposase YbfD/YdcC